MSWCIIEFTINWLFLTEKFYSGLAKLVLLFGEFELEFDTKKNFKVFFTLCSTKRAHLSNLLQNYTQKNFFLNLKIILTLLYYWKTRFNNSIIEISFILCFKVSIFNISGLGIPLKMKHLWFILESFRQVKNSSLISHFSVNI